MRRQYSILQSLGPGWAAFYFVYAGIWLIILMTAELGLSIYDCLINILIYTFRFGIWYDAYFEIALIATQYTTQPFSMPLPSATQFHVPGSMIRFRLLFISGTLLMIKLRRFSALTHVRPQKCIKMPKNPSIISKYFYLTTHHQRMYISDIICSIY
jgi:hypothetical protein